MAKDGKMILPSVDSVPPGATVRLKDGESIQPLDPPKATEEMQEAHRRIGEAMTEEVMGYVPRRVDVKMTRAQAVILRDKLRQLQDTGAKTADGRFVSNRTQAVQWLIENIASGVK